MYWRSSTTSRAAAATAAATAAALLAAPAAAALPAWADRCWDRGARVLWGAVAVMLWATWIWMTLQHRPPRLPGIANFLPLDFVPEFNFAAFSAAAALTAAPLMLANARSCAGRGLGAWFAGTAMTWGLLSTLWLPWIDAAKSYRSVFEKVRAALPARYECVAQRGMGESELSMLSYFLGITATGFDSADGARGDVLLINGLAKAPPADVEPHQWRALWQGARPGDRAERFWLYTQVPLSTNLAPERALAHQSDNPAPAGRPLR